MADLILRVAATNACRVAVCPRAAGHRGPHVSPREGDVLSRWERQEFADRRRALRDARSRDPRIRLPARLLLWRRWRVRLVD